jgi:hypothetical protein
MIIELVFGESCPHVRNKVNFHLQIGYLSLHIQLHLREHMDCMASMHQTPMTTIYPYRTESERERERESVTIVNQSTDTDL